MEPSGDTDPNNIEERQDDLYIKYKTRPAYLGSCGLSSVTLLSNTAE